MRGKKRQKKERTTLYSKKKINRTKKDHTEEESTSHSLHYEFLILALIALFVFLLYSNTLNYPFHFDDRETIIENPSIHLTEISWKQISNIYNNYHGHRYIPLASLAFNYYLNKQNTFGYHLFNVIVHIINGIFIFYFVKMTLLLISRNTPNSEIPYLKFHSLFYIPLFSSLLWLVHPLQTNSVTYIVQRMNSLAAMFYILSMLSYIKGRMFQIRTPDSPKPKTGGEKSWAYKPFLYFVACTIAGFLSAACKENSVTLPFFIILYEFYFFQNLKSSWLKKFIGLAFVIVIFSAILVQIFIGLTIIKWYFNIYYEGFSFTMLQRALTEFRVVIYYITLFFFPHPNRMNFDYDFPLSHSLMDPITTLLSLCAIISLISVSLVYAKKERLLSFGILWFFGNLAIESSIIPLDIIFEHRTYLPSILFSVIFVAIVWRFNAPAFCKIILFSALIVLLSYWTFQRNLVWRNPVTLWHDCVQKSPKKDRPHANLGKSLEMAGRIDEAIIEYTKALAINPYHQFVLNNMGLAMYKKGDLDKAIHYYQKAILSDPDFAEAHNNLGVALVDQNKLEEGISHYKEAIRLKPDHPQAPGNLTKAVEGLQRIDEKITETQNKLKLEPKNIDHYYRLGVLHYLKGHFDDAAEYHRNALSIQPNYVKSLKGLSAIYCMKKEYDSAIAITRKMIELQPENPSGYYDIACIYSLQNKKKHAIKWLQKAIDKGFNKWEMIREDEDLINLRDMQSFKNIIQNQL